MPGLSDPASLFPLGGPAMSFQAGFTIGLLAVTLIVLVGRWLRPDLTALLVMLALILARVLSPAEAFSAFGQPLLIILASVFVLGAALYETGVATIIGNRLLAFADRGETSLLALLMGLAGLLSSVLGGMLVVAVLMPSALRISRRARIPPAQLLLPLATAATVGNQLTLIGTSSNIVIADLLAQDGLPALGLFTLTPYALISLAGVVLWYLLVGRRLLSREMPREERPPSVGEVEQSYGLGNLFYRLRVRSSSDLVGEHLKDTGLRSQANLTVVAIQSPDGALRPATPELVLEADDVLIVEGRRGDVFQAASLHSLELKGTVTLEELSHLFPESLRLAELIVPFRSPLAGKSLAELDLRARYGITVLAVHRQGRTIRENLPELVLQAGDTLLVQGTTAQLRKVTQGLQLVPVTELGPLPGETVTGKARVAVTILGAMLLAVMTGLLPLAVAMLAASLALVLTGCISVERAYASIDARILVLVMGMLPLANALQKTGAADLLATLIAGVGAYLGPFSALLTLYLITSLVTQAISNSVVAALVTPIAVSLALSQGLSPLPFAIATAFGVNAAYVTPLTDGNNLLIQAPGRYTMRDYLVNGLAVFVLQTLGIFGLLYWQLVR